MEEMKRQFEQDMVNIYKTAKKECGYTATRFLQMIDKQGGWATAKQLIAKPCGTDGFAKLWEHGRLDLSVEALVLRSEYQSLFSEEEKLLCEERLKEYGFQLNK